MNPNYQIWQVLTIFNSLLLTDEREDVQKKTFTKWINSQLSKVSSRELFYLHTYTKLKLTQTFRILLTLKQLIQKNEICIAVL